MADYKLTVVGDGDVEYIAPAGSSFVRSCMSEGQAKGIIETATKIEKSDMFDGFGIAVNDGEFYFAGKITSAKSEPKAEKATDEPVKAEKKPVKKTTAKKKAE